MNNRLGGKLPAAMQNRFPIVWIRRVVEWSRNMLYSTTFFVYKFCKCGARAFALKCSVRAFRLKSEVSSEAILVTML